MSTAAPTRTGVPAAARPARRRSGLLTLLRTESLLFARDPLNLAIGVALPTLLVVGLGLVPALREPSENFGGGTFLEFFVPALLAISIAVMGIQGLPIGLATYREKGILRRLSTTPLSPLAVLGVQLLIHLVTVTASTVLLIGVSVLGFGVPAPRHPGAFALVFLVGTAAMFALGLLIAALVPRAKTATAVCALAFMVTQFFGGVYLPKFLLPEAVLRIGEFVPPGTTALADAWLGDGPRVLPVIIMGLVAVAASALAARLFRWE